MSNLLNRLNAVKLEFLVFELSGKNNILCYEDGDKLVPLTVSGVPPEANFIIQTKMMSSFIQHHVEDFNGYTDKIQNTKDTKLKQKILDDMKNSMRASVLKEFENPQDIFQKCLSIGKEYLLQHSAMCWQEDVKDKTPIKFVETEEQKAELEASDSNTIVLLVSLLSIDDLSNVGAVLLEGGKKQVANIPIKDEQGGESSIPANELARFPLTLGKGSIPNV